MTAIGGMASGSVIAMMRIFSADLASISQAFIAYDGSSTAENCKKIIAENEGDDVVYLIFFNGVHSNYFAPAITSV